MPKVWQKRAVLTREKLQRNILDKKAVLTREKNKINMLDKRVFFNSYKDNWFCNSYQKITVSLINSNNQ